ncbi:MAG: hypothetical protein WEG36_08685 [Gemmatimonadota bacterium]
MSETTVAGTATKRRWRIPPPLLQDGGAPGPEGLTILSEFRSELGAVLWKSLRTVVLWAEADPASRRNLFDERAADRRQLEILAVAPDDERAPRAALEDLLCVLAQPERADPEFVGVVCSRIAAWAEGMGARRTQLEFQQAAALSCPANPWFALAVGNGSRDLAQYSRAEAWYFRAVGLARQGSDWEAYVKAYLNNGIMMFRRGALPAARRSYLKALRRSRRQGLREGEAKALHDLFVLEARGTNWNRAHSWAQLALEAHGPGHAQLPRLAHDIAYFWLEQGVCAHALCVFMETLGQVNAGERPTVLGSLARAAAGNRDLAAYRWARQELLRYEPGPGMAEAWVDMARAALALSHRDEALEAAHLAETVARSRREGQMRFLAESVMNEIEGERRAAAERPAPEMPAFHLGTSDELARKLIRTLQLAPARQSVAAGA